MKMNHLILMLLVSANINLFADTNVLTPTGYEYKGEHLIILILLIFSVLTSILLFVWNRRLQNEKIKTDEAIKQLEVVLDSSDIGIWKLDIPNYISYNDKRMWKILGYEQHDSEVSIEEIIQLMHPDDAEDAIQTLQKCLDGDQDDMKIEFRMRKKDGSYCWVHDAAHVTKRDKDGSATEIIGIGMDVTVLKNAQEEAIQANHVNERLLKELYHRVKNNLQVISSFLSLQANYYKNPLLSDLLNESNLRIRAMSLIHEQLSTAKDATQVNMQQYLESIITENLRLHACCKPDWSLEADSLELSISNATLFGLVVNEIFSNAFKHAFPSVEKPCIEFKFWIDAATDTIRLSVKDNGNVKTINNEKPTLGMEIIEALNAQLEGDMQLNTIRGYHYEFSFPRKGPK